MMGLLVNGGVNDNVEEMYQSSMLLFEQAKAVAVEHSDQREEVNQHSGDHGARESVESFLERMERIISGK